MTCMKCKRVLVPFLLAFVGCEKRGAHAVVDLPPVEGKEWRPFQVDFSDNQISLSFCLLNYDEYSDEPWKYPMDGALQKVSRCREQSSRTFTVDELREHMEGRGGGRGGGEFIEPTGFIQHETRCGSTLMANMIAHVPTALMVSESLLPYNIITESLLPYNIITESLLPYNIITESLLPYNIITESLLPYNIITESLLPYNIITESLLPYNIITESLLPYNIITESLLPYNIITESLLPYNIITSQSSWGRRMTRQERADVIQTVVRSLCHTSHGRSACFIKFPSAFYLSDLLTAFPTTPWIFLFRQPSEILASQLGGQWSKHDVFYEKRDDGTVVQVAEPPRKPCLMWAIDYGGAVSTEERCVRGLSVLCREALAALRSSPAGLAVDYATLPDVVADHLWTEHFGQSAAALAHDAPYLSEASRVYSKANKQPARDPLAFDAQGDAAFKESQLTPEALAALRASDMYTQYNELVAMQRWPACGELVALQRWPVTAQ
ncbi:hypothetical protein JKP88DRAFT_349329 [Tribonema minus]|uniref:Sulfotransferase n=1 Tax=Tribonema minus TaxID=303371 RepID=A0A835YUK0_9STRA|nr:hypothetical protein JKP88DRAFT_349329 [Tribonema minus]